ncbi:hypothetical protein B0T19DRAFT_122456 [Cercophora scortea]|uniref:Uncharacterized protein n=1 Tax=Cercophora scortea TaxID=314031 RepID=A0AAE0IXZ2_9PEZI|nr:hypothetical protein B0T19DRAFT_122456 [Cercophora scortea]
MTVSWGRSCQTLVVCADLVYLLVLPFMLKLNQSLDASLRATTVAEKTVKSDKRRKQLEHKNRPGLFHPHVTLVASAYIVLPSGITSRQDKPKMNTSK